MPIAHITINRASSFGLIALRSIIMDGSDSAVTAIMKESITPSCAPLYHRASATGIRAEYIGVHGDSNCRGDNHAKRIILAESLHYPVLRYRIMDYGPYAHSDKDIRKYLFESRTHLLTGIRKPVSYRQLRSLNICAAGFQNKAFHIFSMRSFSTRVPPITATASPAAT